MSDPLTNRLLKVLRKLTKEGVKWEKRFGGIVLFLDLGLCTVTMTKFSKGKVRIETMCTPGYGIHSSGFTTNASSLFDRALKTARS